MRVNFDVDYYNIQVNRPHGAVVADLEAIALGQADAIVLVEAVGYDLPWLPGYGKPVVRDRRNPSRANIAIYVHQRHLGNITLKPWLDQKTTWERPKAPGKRHEPRSFPEVWIGRIQLIGVHQIQRFVAETAIGQREGIDRLVGRMKPRWHRPNSVLRPRLAVGDWNWGRHLPDRGHGPSNLAERIRGKLTGIGIDLGVYRGALRKRKPTQYVSQIGGHRLGSDHRHVVRLHFTVPLRWLRKAKTDSRTLAQFRADVAP